MKRALVIAMLAAACVDEAPVQFSYVYNSIIVTSCTTSACHSSLSRAGAVDLHDEASAYRSLTGRACDDLAAPIGGYVDDADPPNSILSGLLRRSGPTGMPPNGRLADSEIERIEAWMRSGAACD
ncbi:MAG: hypothetical protein H0T46_13250 [Deltaproteobacteria bacterium]|nr:hypothetical protein [Deltaproteobacteria bacterium]